MSRVRGAEVGSNSDPMTCDQTDVSSSVYFATIKSSAQHLLDGEACVCVCVCVCVSVCVQGVPLSCAIEPRTFAVANHKAFAGG